MKLFRLCKARYVASALTGEGTALIGGRWSPRGIPLIYCSDSLRGAIDELLAHVGSATDFLALTIEVPDDVAVEQIDVRALPAEWKNFPAPREAQDVGRRWANSGTSCVLRLPSAILAEEFTFLINPRHVDFSRIAVSRVDSLDTLVPSPEVRELPTKDRVVFLCHASEDKLLVVEPLAKRLQAEGVAFWLDQAEIRWGDSITQKVNDGLATSRYVIVVLSKSFLAKPWPRRELNAALQLEASTGEVRVLPLVVGTSEDVRAIVAQFPLLGDKLFLRWNGSPEPIVAALLQRLSDA